MKAGQKINMKYLIIGAGGTGGVTGYYMKKAGKDVTLIARGEHLKKIQKQGLTLEKMWDKTEENTGELLKGLQSLGESDNQ